MAIVWAIMPPIDAPTTCGGVDAEVVEKAEGVVGEVGDGVRRVDRPAEERADQHLPG